LSVIWCAVSRLSPTKSCGAAFLSALRYPDQFGPHCGFESDHEWVSRLELASLKENSWER
jgi:hypothetical protein